MTDHPDIPDDDIAQRAAAAVRQREVPMGPSPDLVRATLARLERGGGGGGERSFSFASFVRHPLMRIAASVLIVLGIGAVAFWMLAGNVKPAMAEVAFADILGTIKQARSVRSTLDLTFDANRSATADILVVEGGKMRIAYSGGPRKDLITVIDLPAQKALTLLTAQKRAIAVTFDETPASLKRLEEFQLSNLIDHINKTWTANDGRKVGPAHIDGRNTIEFHVSSPDGVAKLWADAGTHLPVRIEIPRRNGAVKLAFHDIQWNQPFDDTLVSCNVPAEYKAEKLQLNLADPTEQDLVESLRAFAAFRGGSFPEDWSLKGLLSSVQKSSLAAVFENKSAAGTPAPNRLQQGLDRALMIKRGLTFAGNDDFGSDWHYAGADAQLGDKDRPLLWYRPLEKETYRVIFADLSVRDVPVSEIPQRPSMIIPEPNFGATKFKF